MSCLGSLGPIQLGDCGSKSEMKVSTSNTSITNLNESLKSLQSQDSQVVLNQQQNVTLTNAANCCKPFVVAQNMKAAIVDTSKMTTAFKSQVANTLVRDINNAISQVAETKSGALVLTPSQGASLKQSVSTALTKMNSTNKIADIISQKVSKTIANQGQKVVIDCGSGVIPPPPPPADAKDAQGNTIGANGCYVTQDFVFSQITNNVMEAIFDSLSKDSEVSKVLNDIKQTNKKEDKGIIDAIFGAWTNIAIAIAAIVGLVFIVLIAVFFWPSGNKTVEALSKSAAEVSVSQFLRKTRRRY